jgi:Flp pilus assembly pilin Flp
MDRMHTALLATFVAGSLHLDARLRRRDERGSVTIEYVLWAVAVIAIVAIVVAAVKAYVTSQAGNIK